MLDYGKSVCSISCGAINSSFEWNFIFLFFITSILTAEICQVLGSLSLPSSPSLPPFLLISLCKCCVDSSSVVGGGGGKLVVIMYIILAFFKLNVKLRATYQYLHLWFYIFVDKFNCIFNVKIKF